MMMMAGLIVEDNITREFLLTTFRDYVTVTFGGLPFLFGLVYVNGTPHTILLQPIPFLVERQDWWNLPIVLH